MGRRIFCFLLFVFTFNHVYGSVEGTFMGCYQIMSNNRKLKTEASVQDCTNSCYLKYYRYSYTHFTTCICSNYLGNQENNQICRLCRECNPDEIADVYYTGISANGPPQNLKIENVTNTSAHVSWEEPESFITINNYKVVANILSTYSSEKLHSLEWTHSNNTFKSELITLHPSTHYNICVSTQRHQEDGTEVCKDFSTKVGVPDQIPSEPEIISQTQEQIKIKLKSVTNNNGPVSSYLIVVIDPESVQAVQTENLKGYRQATEEGISYYITAEIMPDKINEIFTIGDGNTYGKYFNVPLERERTYHIMLGIVSRFEGSEQVVYSQTIAQENNVVVHQMNNHKEEESSILITVLSVAIILICLLLIAGIVAFYFLRNHYRHRHRQRLNDNQELTLQGPMINIENSGYIYEDDNRVAHYDNLNKQVWIIPKNSLNVEHTALLGIGQYGRVYNGSVAKDDIVIPVGVYSIADKKLNPSDKRAMLKDLDLLIKSKKHQNVLDLIGTCENMDTICVVLEYSSTNLKDLLINSRVFAGERFSNLSESQALDFAIDVSKGMEFLHSKKIVHTQLCTAHIAIVNGSSAKICGFGLTKYYKTDKTPDLIRYTAREIFQGQQYVPKCDVWSFACVLWEICALGGTPYGNITNADIPEKVMRGLRLVQLPYIYNSLYQIMLNCWQLDLDERPTFGELKDALILVKNEPNITFSLYQGFQYEPYYLELENTKLLQH